MGANKKASKIKLPNEAAVVFKPKTVEISLIDQYRKGYDQGFTDGSNRSIQEVERIAKTAKEVIKHLQHEINILKEIGFTRENK